MHGSEPGIGNSHGFGLGRQSYRPRLPTAQTLTEQAAPDEKNYVDVMRVRYANVAKCSSWETELKALYPNNNRRSTAVTVATQIEITAVVICQPEMKLDA